MESGSEPLAPQKEETRGGGPGEPEQEPLSRILELLNERFGYDFSEEDRVFIEQLERNVKSREAVRTSIEVNAPSEARLTFDNVAEDELQEMIGKNFQLYKKITDNDAFARMLFDRCLEDVQREAAEGR